MDFCLRNTEQTELSKDDEKVAPENVNLFKELDANVSKKWQRKINEQTKPLKNLTTMNDLMSLYNEKEDKEKKSKLIADNDDWIDNYYKCKHCKNYSIHYEDDRHCQFALCNSNKKAVKAKTQEKVFIDKNGYPMLNTNKACKDVRFKTKLCHDYMRDLKCPRGDHC